MVVRSGEAYVDGPVAGGIAGKISERADGSANEEEEQHRENWDEADMFV